MRHWMDANDSLLTWRGEGREDEDEQEGGEATSRQHLLPPPSVEQPPVDHPPLHLPSSSCLLLLLLRPPPFTSRTIAVRELEESSEEKTWSFELLLDTKKGTCTIDERMVTNGGGGSLVALPSLFGMHPPPPPPSYLWGVGVGVKINGRLGSGDRKGEGFSGAV